jgi:hypothetical protein
VARGLFFPIVTPSPLLYPSQVGVDLSDGHPNRAPSARGFRVDGWKSSQIGAAFRDQTSIGVGLGFLCVPQPALSDSELAKGESNGCPYVVEGYGPLPVSFSQHPTRHRRFVANKGSTVVRPSGHRAVAPLLSRCFGVQFGSILALNCWFYFPVGRGSQLPQIPKTMNQIPSFLAKKLMTRS